jgi:hypothetical protein
MEDIYDINIFKFKQRKINFKMTEERFKFMKEV